VIRPISHPAALLRENERYFSGLALAAGLLYVALLVYLLFIGKLVHAAFLAGLPLVIIAITIPRLAVTQFVMLLSVGITIVDSVEITLIDCSAGIVVLAALFDMLSGTALPRRIPPLVGSFLLLTGAVAVSAIFGFSAVNGITPVIKQLFLIVLLCCLFYLAKQMGVRYLLSLFLATIAIHAVYVAMPYIASGGRVRSFGLSEASFDDISMFALPIALALFLWSSRPHRWTYLIAGLVSTVGLFATQSRAPILFCALGTTFVLLASRWSTKRTENSIGGAFLYVRRRINRIVLSMTLALVLLILFLPSILSTVFSRFGHLIDGRLGETVFLRATLWKAALTAFVDHPLLGIGAGSFRSIREMYPGLMLDPVYFWVRGFSAHNLFLHYLAETGVVGASMLIMLFGRTVSLSRKAWRKATTGNIADEKTIGTSLALYVVGGVLLLSTFVDAGWMWGLTSYVFVFFASLIARHFVDTTGPAV